MPASCEMLPADTRRVSDAPSASIAASVAAFCCDATDVSDDVLAVRFAIVVDTTVDRAVARVVAFGGGRISNCRLVTALEKLRSTAS